MSTQALSVIRTRLEQEVKVDSSDAYVGSALELQDINEAYQQSAYAYDWRELLDRVGILLIANVSRYTLPTNFRKARHVKVRSVIKEEIELETFPYSRNSFAVDRVNGELILREIPDTATTSYNITGAATASTTAVTTIGLTSSSSLSAQDEIWMDAAAAGADEFTVVSSVPGATSITAKLRANKATSDKLYRVNDIIDLQYFKKITFLSAAGDLTLLHDVVDFIIPHYAAHLYFEREQEYDRSKAQLEIWKSRLQDAWYTAKKMTTGPLMTFGIKE